MFGLFGGKSNRKRRVNVAEKKQRNAVAAAPTYSANKPPLTSRRRQPNDDHFLENSSVDMSLYTTPSRSTINYQARLHQSDWKSRPDEASLFSSEVAKALSNLGGGQTRSNPSAISRKRDSYSTKNGLVLVASSNEDASSPHSNDDRSVEDDSSLIVRQSATKRVSERISKLAPMRNFNASKPITSKRAGSQPVDVDSLLFVEPDDGTIKDSTSVGEITFSDILSNFELQSLGDGIAPALATTHRERANGKGIENKMVEQVLDDENDTSDIPSSIPPSQIVFGEMKNCVVPSISEYSSKKSPRQSFLKSGWDSRVYSPGRFEVEQEQDPDHPTGSSPSSVKSKSGSVDEPSKSNKNTKKIDEELQLGLPLYLLSREGVKSVAPNSASSKIAERSGGDHHSQNAQSSQKSSVSSKQQVRTPMERTFSPIASDGWHEKILPPEILKPSRSQIPLSSTQVDQKSQSSSVKSKLDESMDVSSAAPESLDDISFSGFFSKCEAESLAGRLDPLTVSSPGQFIGKTILTAVSTRNESLRSADDLSIRPDEITFNQADSESEADEEIQQLPSQDCTNRTDEEHSEKSASPSYRTPSHQRKVKTNIDAADDTFFTGSETSNSNQYDSKTTNSIDGSHSVQKDGLQRLASKTSQASIVWDRLAIQSRFSADVSVSSLYSSPVSEGVVHHESIDEMSFSGLLSKFEGSSLAAGLAPLSEPISGKLIGLTVQTESKSKLANKTTWQGEENGAFRSVNGENSAGSLSNKSILLPAVASFDSTEEHARRPTAGLLPIGVKSGANFRGGSSLVETAPLVPGNAIEDQSFSGILRKFEAQSLSNRLAPPAPQRLIRKVEETNHGADGNSSRGGFPINEGSKQIHVIETSVHDSHLNVSILPDFNGLTDMPTNFASRGRANAKTMSGGSVLADSCGSSAVSEQSGVASVVSARSLSDDDSALAPPPLPEPDPKFTAKPFIKAPVSPARLSSWSTPPQNVFPPDPPCKIDYSGPIDLDDSVADSNSESSSGDVSAIGTGSRHNFAELSSKPHKDFSRRSGPAAPLTKTPPSISIAVGYVDDDDKTPVAWDDDNENDGYDSRNRRGAKWSPADEEILGRTYNETMESISISTRETSSQKCSSPTSNLLTEDQLIKHTKSTEFKEPLPSSCIQGYDSWKMQREMQHHHFGKTMNRKSRCDGSERHQPKSFSLQGQLAESRQQTHAFHFTTARGTEPSDTFDGTQSIMEASMSSTIPTVEGSHSISRNKKSPQKPSRGWNFLGTILHKNDEGVSSDSRRQQKKNLPKNKREPAVVTLDHFMRISSDEPDDVDGMSLAPLNELGMSNNFDEPKGQRKLVLENLERERRMQRLAERERDNSEKREQQRISLLKQRELDRQRRLNRGQYSESLVVVSKSTSGSRKAPKEGSVSSPRASNDPVTVSTAKDTTSLDSHSQESFLNENVSFEFSASASSVVNSPTSVTQLTPCVVCKRAERTHLSLPCMHYSFCKDCANDLYRKVNPACPVCLTENIAFRRVHTSSK